MMKKLMNIVEFAGEYLGWLFECYFNEIIKILLKNVKGGICGFLRNQIVANKSRDN